MGTTEQAAHMAAERAREELAPNRQDWETGSRRPWRPPALRGSAGPARPPRAEQHRRGPRAPCFLCPLTPPPRPLPRRDLHFRRDGPQGAARVPRTTRSRAPARATCTSRKPCRRSSCWWSLGLRVRSRGIRAGATASAASSAGAASATRMPPPVGRGWMVTLNQEDLLSAPSLHHTCKDPISQEGARWVWTADTPSSSSYADQQESLNHTAFWGTKIGSF